jgi:hypothetical protein
MRRSSLQRPDVNFRSCSYRDVIRLNGSQRCDPGARLGLHSGVAVRNSPEHLPRESAGLTIRAFGQKTLRRVHRSGNSLVTNTYTIFQVWLLILVQILLYSVPTVCSGQISPRTKLPLTVSYGIADHQHIGYGYDRGLRGF